MFLLFFSCLKEAIDIFNKKGNISSDDFINISYFSELDSISLKYFFNRSNASFLSNNILYFL